MSKRHYTESSGNVFADLGNPPAEEALANAELAQKIIDATRTRHLTQVQAAEQVIGLPGKSENEWSNTQAFIRPWTHDGDFA
jgi:hypothetical protein